MSKTCYPLRFAYFITVLLGALLHVASSARAAEPISVTLADGGIAGQQVVVSATAADAVKQSAQILADILQRMTGAAFPVTVGDGTQGVAVGVFSDFPAVQTGMPFDGIDARKREEYLLRSHPRGLYLIGATEQAVQHAVWDCLHRLGYRQFFPGPTWEVVPDVPTARIAVDAYESPDYLARRIWYGYGTYNRDAYHDWCAKNRTAGGIALNTGHAYEAIIKRHHAVFAAHPEYLALVKGARQTVDGRNQKFCIANPELRALVVRDSVARFDANPKTDSISLDPSDGGGWCECEACAAMGSISDRVLTLANESAEAVIAKHPGKLIGIYAYYLHSPPPTIRVHSNVIVSVATSFIQPGYTFEGLLDGWTAQGAQLGLRDYYGVIAWGNDMPGRVVSTNLAALQQRIPFHHAKGARYLSSETTDGWAPNGLGHYLAARMLWDVTEAVGKEEIVEDFLTRCFGAAKEPMRRFYGRIDGGNKPQLGPDLIGRMYRDLREAGALAVDPQARARIEALALYTRFVELFFEYNNAQGDERLQAFERVVRHAYSIRGTGMVGVYSFYRDRPSRDRSITVPENARWSVPDAENPWKQDPMPTPAEIEEMVTRGIARHAPYPFTPVDYSNSLVPATPLGLPDVPDSMPDLTTHFPLTVSTWVPKGVTEVTLAFHGNGRRFTLRSPKGQQPLQVLEMRPFTGIPRDEPKPVALTTTQEGLHTVGLDGPSATLTISFSLQGGLPMTVHADNPFQGEWSLYFYVPKGTAVVGGYSAAPRGAMLDSHGRQVIDFTAMDGDGYFSVPVPPGEDGKLWKMQQAFGTKRLMTVPPYYARNTRELLLPQEVIEVNQR
jgi:hypothetical protein